jgi:hypothetical protein
LFKNKEASHQHANHISLNWLLSLLRSIDTLVRDHPGIQFGLEILVFICLLYHADNEFVWILFVALITLIYLCDSFWSSPLFSTYY